MKRKVRVWNKIRLYETSVVGIPAYPDAHASVESFSLIKALTNASLKGFAEETETISETELNKMEVKETMENSQTAEIRKEEEVKEEPAKEPEAPAEEEAAEKSEDTESEEEDEAEKKSDMSAVIAKAIAKGIKDGLKELETERGGVEKQTPTEKSIGEMAIQQGLFVTK